MTIYHPRVSLILAWVLNYFRSAEALKRQSMPVGVSSKRPSVRQYGREHCYLVLDISYIHQTSNDYYSEAGWQPIIHTGKTGSQMDGFLSCIIIAIATHLIFFNKRKSNIRSN